MFSTAWHLSEGIWQFGFLAMACHHGIPQSKALSDMLFLHCLACNVQYVKKHCCPFHTVYYQIPFCCIVFFHKLLNIAEYILFLDWPQAPSKCFCSFNSVLNVGTLCAPAKPFVWNHHGKYPWAWWNLENLALSRDILELQPAGTFTSMCPLTVSHS